MKFVACVRYHNDYFFELEFLDGIEKIIKFLFFIGQKNLELSSSILITRNPN
jgi:hypothetical protein